MPSTCTINGKTHYFFMEHGGCWCGERHFTEQEAEKLGSDFFLHPTDQTFKEELWKLNGALRQLFSEIKKELPWPLSKLFS